MVEILVVLVIVAILAAVLIPHLAVYMDKATQGVVAANQRWVLDSIRYADVGNSLPGEGAESVTVALRTELVQALKVADGDNRYSLKHPHSGSQEILTAAQASNASYQAPAIVVASSNNLISTRTDSNLYPMTSTESVRKKLSGVVVITICKDGYLVYNFYQDKIYQKTPYYYNSGYGK